jgi:hypothetical protein
MRMTMNGGRWLALAAGGAIGLSLCAADAADWQPAQGPLMTRWAKDVSPSSVHSEYPRPQTDLPPLLRREFRGDFLRKSLLLPPVTRIGQSSHIGFS